jgi:hypothetical protein
MWLYVDWRLISVVLTAIILGVVIALVVQNGLLYRENHPLKAQLEA